MVNGKTLSRSMVRPLAGTQPAARNTKKARRFVGNFVKAKALKKALNPKKKPSKIQASQGMKKPNKIQAVKLVKTRRAGKLSKYPGVSFFQLSSSVKWRFSIGNSSHSARSFALSCSHGKVHDGRAKSTNSNLGSQGSAETFGRCSKDCIFASRREFVLVAVGPLEAAK
jgi:hypothetical protein